MWLAATHLIGISERILRDGPPARSAAFRAPERRNGAGNPQSRGSGRLVC